MRFSFVVIAIAIAVVSSQLTRHLAAAQVPPTAELAQGVVTLSGEEIGFQLERVRGNIAHGRLMVRVKGRWLEAGPSQRPSTRQLSQR
jgi:hypothetical protein